MEPVFYTRLYNDTIFFDGLSTKKTKTSICPVLVPTLKVIINPFIINTRHAQEAIKPGGKVNVLSLNLLTGNKIS